MAPKESPELDAFIWSMRAATKTCRLVVLARTGAEARTRAEDHLVEGGLTREEAAARLDVAMRQVAEARDGIFSFWTDR